MTIARIGAEYAHGGMALLCDYLKYYTSLSIYVPSAYVNMS